MLITAKGGFGGLLLLAVVARELKLVRAELVVDDRPDYLIGGHGGQVYRRSGTRCGGESSVRLNKCVSERGGSRKDDCGCGLEADELRKEMFAKISKLIGL